MTGTCRDAANEVSTKKTNGREVAANCRKEGITHETASDEWKGN